MTTFLLDMILICSCDFSVREVDEAVQEQPESYQQAIRLSASGECHMGIARLSERETRRGRRQCVVLLATSRIAGWIGGTYLPEIGSRFFQISRLDVV